MNISLSASVTGLDEDIAGIEGRFRAALKNAMFGLKDDIAVCLIEHIEKDVYGKWQPKDYIRRGTDGGLADIENSDFSIDPDSVKLTYLPSGETDQAEFPIHGDALIGRIERREPNYDWNGHQPGNRPFFTNFLGEMIEEGRAERALVDGIKAADEELGVTADGISTTRDGDEGFSD